MEIELRYLGDRGLFNSYSEEMLQIIKEDFNQDQLHRGSVLPIAIDCFELGVIVGKKNEREKHKTSNDEVLKRQKELLLDIESLRLRNKKLEMVVANIKKECLGTPKKRVVLKLKIKK